MNHNNHLPFNPKYQSGLNNPYLTNVTQPLYPNDPSGSSSSSNNFGHGSKNYTILNSGNLGNCNNNNIKGPVCDYEINTNKDKNIRKYFYASKSDKKNEIC